MSPILLGAIIGVCTITLLATGIPIAFGLGIVSVAALVIFEGFGVLDVLADTLFAGLDEFTIVSIPMFMVMGAAVAKSPAGKDLYEALDRWLYRIPGGLIIANIGACSIFSALSGSSPATCAAIGKMGIPEMRERGYPPEIATGSIAAGGTLGILIPPSVTMIVYGISTETSIGKLFLAGLLPGFMLTCLFMIWTLFYSSQTGKKSGKISIRFSLKQRLESLPKVLPFIIVIIGVLYVLYGGLATPSETAGVGAFFCILMVAIVYKIWSPVKIWDIVASSTKESIMIMMIFAASGLISFTLSSLYITQSVAELIAEMQLNPWVLIFIINIFLLVAGFFLPPVAVILMTAPILLPIIENAGFDPYWFAVIFTINMEIGLITPPVGLNLYVINAIVPDIELGTVLRGALPYMVCMVIGIVILCIFPEIATYLPVRMMG